MFEDDEGDEWSSDDEVSFLGLLSDSDQQFGSVEALIVHLSTIGLDLRQYLSSKEEENIMLVNFIRRMAVSGSDSEGVARLCASLNARAFVAEEYMRPTLQDDQLLFLINDYVFSFGGGEEEVESGPPITTATESGANNFKDEYNKLKALVQGIVSSPEEQDSNKDQYYFDGYSGISIHEDMLRDHARTFGYMTALSLSSSVIQGKTVMDVGCGTGVLSVFAAKGGAAKVVGIERGGMAAYAKVIVADNGCADVVTIVHGSLEELRLPELEKRVDVIVSEWMGYGLYFENMLASVIVAREKYLAPGGTMIPATSTLYVEAGAFTDSADRLGFWRDVFGVNMCRMQPQFLEDAQVQLVDAESIKSDRATLHCLDLALAEDEDLDFTNEFELVMSDACLFNALVITFDVTLIGDQVLSTRVDETPTHWKHAVLWLSDANSLALSQGDRIKGTIKYERRDVNRRDYVITAEWRVFGNDTAVGDSRYQQRFMLRA